MTRVVIIGAGIVGAACAYYATRAGLSVTVVERQSVAAGTTSSGEGNLLLSDKTDGPELSMALRSLRLWGELAETFGAQTLEYERKGGVIVAKTDTAMTALAVQAAEQSRLGVPNQLVDPAGLRQLEPHLGPRFAGGAYYPDDAQIQPGLATARLLRAATEQGARVRLEVDVRGLELTAGRVSAVRTNRGRVEADYVVNAAGTWAGELSTLLGAPVPVAPRRGFILVTEPLPPIIRHKVYSADYVANVASSAEGLETSSVVEGTRSGTVLIGASRERVDFQRTISLPVVRELAAQAVDLFPVLRDVNLMRVYVGFRPYCPDHLPIVGFDGRLPGLLHACGHEGAGIGLAPATGELIAELIAQLPTTLDGDPFSPHRLIGRAA